MNSVIVAACRSFFSEINRETIDVVIYYRKFIATAICVVSTIIFVLGLMFYGGSKGRKEGILDGIIMISAGVIGMVSPCFCFLGSYFMTHYRRVKREREFQQNQRPPQVIEIHPRQQDITDPEPIEPIGVRVIEK